MNAHRNRLAWLEGLLVLTDGGTRLGHVFEIHSPGRAETEPSHDARTVGYLLCGRRGLLERLGWKEPDARAIPWSSMVAVRTDAVIVRGQPDSFRRPGIR